MKAPTPRVIFVRHGQTEWSKSGQHTSVTDLDLTPFGVIQMEKTGHSLIGHEHYQMIKPENLKHIVSSPRTRAQHTVQLLLSGLTEDERKAIQISVDEDIREWEYGDYEGLLTQQIKDLRKERGLDKDKTWNIWRDGCENGETYVEVTKRVDRMIEKIRAIHKKALDAEEPCDVLVVGHGHILRCFAARWVNQPINTNPNYMLDAGGVGVLSYQHRNINEPALYLAGAFTVPVEEKSADL
ncbi:Sedoheptulose 1,7-bisphosphatase [Candidozyma auris]|uniref:Phosphoglycerate mutase-like protein n=2 Tax=Candidozyma auris TaxID=498019 RepID=A0A2H0ZCY1_CANAR|nr:phosphoglycerate mutase-like protein [[Candida] auris]PIS48484.1 hypothetical protein B9J08_005177 [[Candida] auris]QWW24742.1 hypothetical protein CA7LBN_003599 [[Candida] auris]